jgi:hypothetical protein
VAKIRSQTIKHRDFLGRIALRHVAIGKAQFESERKKAKIQENDTGKQTKATQVLARSAVSQVNRRVNRRTEKDRRAT